MAQFTEGSLFINEFCCVSIYFFSQDITFIYSSIPIFNIYIRFGVAGVTYRTSGYFGTGANINNSGTSQSGEATAYIPTTTPQTQELGSQANEGWKYGYVTVNNPMGTTNHTCALGSVVYYSQTPQLCWLNFGGFYETSKEAHVATRFYISAGTMTSGSIFQYRRQRS